LRDTCCSGKIPICQPTGRSLRGGHFYLFDTFLVDDDTGKFSVLALFGLNTLNCGQDPLLALLLLLADTVSSPAAPAGERLIDHLVALFFDGIELLLLKCLHNLVTGECSLHEIMVLEQHRHVSLVVAVGFGMGIP
jgi:hypothetical protein